MTSKMYNSLEIVERHRHRYEVNSVYADKLIAAGLNVVGRSVDNSLVEIIELRDHPWYIGCQFHPEFHSKPHGGHPLFNGFIRAGLQFKQERH